MENYEDALKVVDLNRHSFLLCSSFPSALFMPRWLTMFVCPPVNPHVTVRDAQRLFTKYGIGAFSEILSAHSDGDQNARKMTDCMHLGCNSVCGGERNSSNTGWGKKILHV